MFKKGQLLRNKHLGYFLEVVSWPLCRWTHGVQALITVHHRDVTLVGNNYQAKPKCSR